MTLFYLVRHGETGIGDRLVGRSAGVHLSDEGRRQAMRTAERFSGLQIAALYSSPLERAMETAQPIAAAVNRDIQRVDAISEVDFGDWTGKSFAALAADERWRQFNLFRSIVHIPGGENMLQLQARFAGWMEDVRRRHVNENVVLVSHKDPIKAAVMYYSGLHADMYARFEIDAASTTVVRVEDHGACVLTLNNDGQLPVA